MTGCPPDKKPCSERKAQAVSLFIHLTKTNYMSKSIVKDKQQFHRATSLLLTGIPFSLILALSLNEYVLHRTSSGIPFWVIGMLLVFLPLSGWYLWQLSFKVSVSEAGISYKYRPLHRSKQHIPWEEIASYEFVQSGKAGRWAGNDVHFALQEDMFSLCGRNGLAIQTDKGRQVFLGSRELLRNRELIEDLIRTTRSNS
jgi:hypothetical protein